MNRFSEVFKFLAYKRKEREESGSRVQGRATSSLASELAKTPLLVICFNSRTPVKTLDPNTFFAGWLICSLVAIFVGRFIVADQFLCFAD
jgi:hypothetical protein